MSRPHRIQLTLLMAPLVAIAATGCIADPAAIDRRPGAIVGGVDNTSDDAVVALLGHVGSATYLCSGILVAQRTVLTAAHCVHGRDSIDVLFATDIHDEETVVAEIAAASWQQHPDWQNTASDLFDQHYDLALVLLSADAPTDPALFNRIALDEDRLGAAVRLIGYGDTYNNAYDSGKRREASTALGSYDSWWTTAGGYDANTCVGDSGGPQLMQVGGAEVVVGVTSFGTAPAGEEMCRFDTIAARVDIAAVDFIDAFITAHDSPTPCGADDACLSACRAPAQDPDCQELCVADGHCETSCGDYDPDCAAMPDAGASGQLDAGTGSSDAGEDPPDQSGGGCRLAGNRSSGGSPVLMLLAWLAIRPRRPRRARSR